MSAEQQTKHFKWFLIIILITFAARVGIPKLLDKSVYRHQWYKVSVPEGWKVKKGEDEVSFISPEKNDLTGLPFAIFSIYGKQSKGALFLDDFFVDVIQSFQRRDGKILDKGEIKIDGQVAKWILFNNNKPPLAILTFYMVDDWNRFTRIQYIAQPDKFAVYRTKFEQFKNSLKLKKFL